MFELALGAEWALCGAKVELLEPDLVLKVPDRGYLIACKREGAEDAIFNESFGSRIVTRKRLLPRS